MQGGSIALGAVNGMVYYTEDGDAYQVVATLVTGPESTPVRVTATLHPDQEITLSVPGPAGTPGEAVRLAHRGDRLVVGVPESTPVVLIIKPGGKLLVAENVNEPVPPLAAMV